MCLCLTYLMSRLSRFSELCFLVWNIYICQYHNVVLWFFSQWTIIKGTCQLEHLIYTGLLEKSQREGGLRTYFLKNPAVTKDTLEFWRCYFTLQSPCQKKASPLKTLEICVTPLGIYTFFHDHSWMFYMYALFLVSLLLNS